MRPGARASGLPFNLERYNVVYMGLLSLIVLGGTTYSLIHKTHAFNVLLSDPQSAFAIATSAGSELSSDGIAVPSSFLADRRNLLNRLFTKFAWFWTTAAFLAQVATLRNLPVQSAAPSTVKRANTSSDESSAEREKEESQSKNGTEANLQATVMGAMSISLLRYMIATTLWVFFARWFLGPSLMERLRHYSGATCVPIQRGVEIEGLPTTIEAQYCYTGKSLGAKDFPHLTHLFSSASLANGADVLLRPKWKGGHDISGHTYILIISSLYLLEEITPFLPYLLSPSLQGHLASLFPRSLWSPRDPFAVTSQQPQAAVTRNLIVTLSIIALIGFWTLSLAVTAVYFHTPQEKLSGLLVALAASLLIPKGG